MLSPILLVDDNPLDVDLTRRAFAAGKSTRPLEVARDGEEALAFVGRWDAGEPTPAVILLDIKLPRLSGLDVLRRLKTHPRYKMIPVVMLTTSAQDRDIREAYRLGANSYIIKPAEFEMLIQATHQLDAYWRGLNCAPQMLRDTGTPR